MLECLLTIAEAGARLREDRRTQEEPGPDHTDKPERHFSVATTVFAFFFALFAAGGIFFGYVFATTILDLLSEGSMGPLLPSLPLPHKTGPGPRPTPAGPGSVGQSEPSPMAEPVWQGRDRMTILLLGLDTREDERNQPTRSDTMILVTVDPAQKRAGMLSIPRDLWVPIPGHGENKINTAHFFGELDKPGGGPALARRVVEYNLGVRVNYYARVDFRGFEELIDAIGGITVDVERPIKDDEYPAGPASEGGICRVYIPTGLQHMDGRTALRYARSRHGDNDFARNHRQQTVLLAARTQVLQPSILPRVPQMIGILRDALQTDVPLTDILPIFNMARGIQSKDIVVRSIDYSMTIDYNGDGTVLIPDRRKIQKVVEEVFGDHPPPSTPTPTPSPTATPTRTAIGAVRVLNGTLRDGLARATADRLAASGYEIKHVGNAAKTDYAETVVMDHTSRDGVAARIARLLDVPTTAIRPAQPVEDGSDVTIILGANAPQL